MCVFPDFLDYGNLTYTAFRKCAASQLIDRAPLSSHTQTLGNRQLCWQNLAYQSACISSIHFNV